MKPKTLLKLHQQPSGFQVFVWIHLTRGCIGFTIICRIGSSTIYRTIIQNLGYKALLIGIKLQEQGSKLKSCRKSSKKSVMLVYSGFLALYKRDEGLF